MLLSEHLFITVLYSAPLIVRLVVVRSLLITDQQYSPLFDFSRGEEDGGAAGGAGGAAGGAGGILRQIIQSRLAEDKVHNRNTEVTV